MMVGFNPQQNIANTQKQQVGFGISKKNLVKLMEEHGLELRLYAFPDLSSSNGIKLSGALTDSSGISIAAEGKGLRKVGTPSQILTEIAKLIKPGDTLVAANPVTLRENARFITKA